MKKKLFIFVVILSLIVTSLYSISQNEVISAEEKKEELVANEWKYDEWSPWNTFISDKRLSDSPWAIAKLFGANTKYSSEENTYEREYLGLKCSSWFLFICTNIDYEYRDRTRNRWYEEGYTKVSDDVWIMGALYEVEEHKESSLQGFEQKKVVDAAAHNEIIGYNKKDVVRYNSWSGWNTYQRANKLSDSSDWIWGSKKYSTDTYEREYLGSVCTRRGFLGICKSKEYKYRDRSRTSYIETIDDLSNPITRYVEETYKYVDDYTKPIYSYGEYEYANAKLLISLNAIVEGVSNEGIYNSNVTINWTHDSDKYGVKYTATLNDNRIDRNYVVKNDGIYFLNVTGTNSNGESYTKEVMFAINRDENVGVVDYKDPQGNVIYREFVKNGEKSKVKTYVEDDKMHIEIEQKSTVSSLAYSRKSVDTSTYAHNKFYDKLLNADNDSNETYATLMAETMVLVEVGTIALIVLMAGVFYLATADPDVFTQAGLLIETIIDEAYQLLVDIGNWVKDALTTAWNWIVGLFVAKEVVEVIEYVDDYSDVLDGVKDILDVAVLTASTVIVMDKVTTRDIEIEYTNEKNAACRLATTPMFEGYPVVFDSIGLTVEMAAAVLSLNILFLGAYCANPSDALKAATLASDPGTTPIPHPAHKGGLSHFHPGSLTNRSNKKHSHVFYG